MSSQFLYKPYTQAYIHLPKDGYYSTVCNLKKKKKNYKQPK
jgi:hypothetical protein